MLITIRAAINRCVPEPTHDSNSRNINSHSQIRVRLCGDASADRSDEAPLIRSTNIT